MAEFKILTHLNGTHLHLKLVGTFDGVSGGQLIALLRRYIQKVSMVIIHTSSLNKILSDQDEFKNNLLSLQQQPVQIMFAGEYALLFN